MIILFIIVSILYLLLVFFVISLYYSYRKDIEELENRLLQLEKRVIDNSKNLQRQIIDINNREMGVSDMACKKGRGGRKK